MKLIWGIHARLIWLGAKIQSKQMGSNHSSVLERVVPWIKKSKAHAVISTQEDQSLPPDTNPRQ